LANAVSFIALVSREESTREQGNAHDQLHDEVEIRLEGSSGTEKAFHWEKHRIGSSVAITFLH
jgi:hypothetical protein